MDPNKQIRYSHYQISDKVQFGGLMDQEQCRALAKKIIDLYDSNQDGSVDSFEIGYMLSDCYRAMNKGFNPTPTDVASYTRVLDKTGSGKVRLQDIEQLCIKYFAGQTQASNGQQPSFNQQSSVPQNTSNVQRPEKLNRIAQERLEVARKIFRKIDRQNNGYITEIEVPDLLRETYKQMGMNYEPTPDDVATWIKMTDTDNDGRVTLEDYENLVLRSLKQQGISLD